MHARLLIALIGYVALAGVPDASAGGSFERIVGVGANGGSRVIELEQSGPQSDSALGGPAVAVPRSGYVRLYPFIGGLPAVPGRFYPADHVLCLYWHEPASNCWRLRRAGQQLLAPLAKLPVWHRAPTTPVGVSYRSHLLPYADGNIFAALELALERPWVRDTSAPPDGVELTVTWHGPTAVSRPRRLLLTPTGVYTPGRLFPLQRGPWCDLAGRLSDEKSASALLIEAVTRDCH
jgi:hypothetical protein